MIHSKCRIVLFWGGGGGGGRGTLKFSRNIGGVEFFENQKFCLHFFLNQLAVQVFCGDIYPKYSQNLSLNKMGKVQNGNILEYAKYSKSR